MRPWLRKLVKGTVVAVGIVALLVGGAIVGFRVLVTRLPSYQDDVRAWVSDQIGMRLNFARLDARWGWRGPELTFREASVAAEDDATPFLKARIASVGVRPMALIARLVTKRELGVDRLTLEGTELTVVQTAEGSFHLQGAQPSGPNRPVFAFDVPPNVEVLVRDSRVLYLDQGRRLLWDFQEVAGTMRRDTVSVLIEAQARPFQEFARRIDVRAQGFITDDGAAQRAAVPRGRPTFTGDWRVSVEAQEVDLGVAGRLLPESNVLPQAGRGDVALWVEWQRGEPVGGTADIELAGVEVPGVLGAARSRYERIALTADWQRTEAAWRVALQDLAVEREGRSWPAGTAAEIELVHGAAGVEKVALRSDFLRLEDLTPLLVPLPESRLRETWYALAPRGDLRDTQIELARASSAPDVAIDYNVAVDFAGLGINPLDDAPGFDSLTGAVRADSRSGRLELRGATGNFAWPSLFRRSFEVTELDGLIVWRQGQDAVRVVSDDLVLATSDARTRTNLELTLPLDGSSPLLDLETSISEFDVTAVNRYLPTAKMPPGVVSWLDQALRGGRARAANITFLGPVRAFPFDSGDGEFRATVDVEGGELAFIRDWPRALELTGIVEFVNASFAARGSGQVLGNRTADVRVGIDDLRAAVLTLQADTIGPLGQVLAFLQGAPLIAREMGPNFARLEAPSGTGEVSVDLALPLRDRGGYELDASLGIIDGELAFRGFGPHASEIQGSLAFRDGALRGEGIRAIFLDGPITARVDPPAIAGYRSRLTLDGEVTIDAVVDAFNLPFAERLAGQTDWQGSLLIPAAGSAEPPRIIVDSNLSGVALRFPEPFEKPPGEPANLQVEFTFPQGGGLDLQGYVGASRRFALQFDPEPSGAGKLEFRRAAVRFGGALPEFRLERGVTVDGSLPELRVDDWLPLSGEAREASPGGAGDGPRWGASFAGGELNVAAFSAFGQELGSTRISARKRTDDWQIELDSDPIAGTLLVPIDLGNDPRIVAVMRRLYLNAGAGTARRQVDPRQLPGLQLHADEFAIGTRQLGRLDAEILSDPLGLRLASFESSSESFSAQGSGGWFTGADGDTTRFAVSITSVDVAKTLEALGFDPFMEAKSAEVTASIYWPGPPTGDWMQHVGGDLALRTEEGSLVDLQPGAGRVVGLFSFSALPRRLALDFRDVFNRGFVFDEITADFVVIDGNAYTDNLKLTGPVAEIGVIGRTGLRDHDYRQQAVVTAEPGKVLPTVGALIAGPAVAAALLIFTRIFKKPLAGIGRVSYCVTGSWQAPVVERLTDEKLEQGELCAELPPSGAPVQPEEVAAR
jgi:uncharacterized protein (TIGR02099 family)